MQHRETGVVVIGTGVIGAATAYALAKRGADVIALDRFEIGHGRGSSHGTSRIFRFSYHDPMYVRMAQRALEMWRALEEASGMELVRFTGGLDFGKPLDDHIAALEECGADHEVIDGHELMKRWPYMSAPPDVRVLYQPNAGISRADRAWTALVTGARARGATVEEGVTVTGLTEADGGVTVTTDRGEIHAATAVVTAGPWAKGLLAPLGIDLPVRPSLETVAYFAMEGALDVPSVVDWSEPAFYSLASPEPLAIKAGLHHAGPLADPDEPQEPSSDTVERVSAWVRERFPAADPDPIAVHTCFYTNTPDENFIIERRGSMVIGSPCSGHGFKFAPLNGERLAELALGTAA